MSLNSRVAAILNCDVNWLHCQAPGALGKYNESNGERVLALQPITLHFKMAARGKFKFKRPFTKGKLAPPTCRDPQNARINLDVLMKTSTHSWKLQQRSCEYSSDDCSDCNDQVRKPKSNLPFFFLLMIGEDGTAKLAPRNSNIFFKAFCLFGRHRVQ